MKQFANTISKDGNCFKNLYKKFLCLSKTKMKEEIFVGPDICKFMKYKEFETSMARKEKKAWVAY